MRTQQVTVPANGSVTVMIEKYVTPINIRWGATASVTPQPVALIPSTNGFSAGLTPVNVGAAGTAGNSGTFQNDAFDGITFTAGATAATVTVTQSGNLA